MNRVKKIVQTAAKFLALTFLVCFIISLIYSAFVYKEFSFVRTINDLSDAFLYLIGYGDASNFNSLLKNVLAIFGVVSLSLLSAFLTVKLFWRTDVAISKNLAIYKNDNSEYYAAVLIQNRGKPVCRIQLTISTYTSTGQMLGAQEYYFPTIPKNGLQQINIPITIMGDNNFIYNSMRNMIKKGSESQELAHKLYILWSFVDVSTGQESIKMQEYSLASFAYLQYNKEVTLTSDFLKNPQTNLAMKDMFTDWIKGTAFPIPIELANPINVEVISLLREVLPGTGGNSLRMRIDFNNVDVNGKFIEFGMACIPYIPPQDWTFYYDHDCYFEFEIMGSEEVRAIQLEIKNKAMDIIINQEIAVTNDFKHQSIRLIDANPNPDAFKEISQVDFTVFQRGMYHPKGEISIINCNLVEMSESPKA